MIIFFSSMLVKILLDSQMVAAHKFITSCVLRNQLGNNSENYDHLSPGSAVIYPGFTIDLCCIPLVCALCTDIETVTDC